MAKSLTTTEVAQRLHTDPKKLRKFLRSADSPIQAVGSGNRYTIMASDISKVRSRFKKWQSEHTRQAA